MIMNPPFTSNTKHYDAGDGVLNAAFAAFNASEKDQSDMARLLKQRAKDTAYHGHAGLGSAFAALADRKVRPGGVAAFVLPFTAVTGSVLGQVQKDDRNSIHRHNDIEHRGQWARYVVFLGYGHG